MGRENGMGVFIRMKNWHELLSIDFDDSDIIQTETIQKIKRILELDDVNDLIAFRHAFTDWCENPMLLDCVCAIIDNERVRR